MEVIAQPPTQFVQSGQLSAEIILKCSCLRGNFLKDFLNRIWKLVTRALGKYMFYVSDSWGI